MVKTVLTFPGQGSQAVGMGKDLAEAFPEAREVFAEVDDVLGAGLSTLMFQGPAEDLQLTHNAQPAIVAHSLAVHRIVAGGLRVVAVAGHSVGEFAAYAAAGTLSLGDAVRLVRKRGELMLHAGQQRPGTMAAVIGLPSEEVSRICSEISSPGLDVVAANLNSPEQSVLSGDVDAVARAGEACKLAGAKRVLALHVSGAFHSPLMEPAVAPFRAALDAAAFSEPSVPVVSSARAELVTSAARAREVLDRQLAEPVHWVDCVRTVAREFPGATLAEIGPGKVLSGLNRRILEAPALAHFGTAAEIDAFLEAAS